MASNSALYIGSVAHRRLRPKKHSLRYRVFSLLIDIDELPDLSERLQLFSLRKFGLFSLDPTDYLFEKTGDLRGEIQRILSDAGLMADNGPILLLTMPRVLGYGFNPLSIFFCHKEDGSLHAIIYEVHNTFGESHCYLFPVENQSQTLSHACSKEFYVSPFLPMDLAYSFRIRPPGDSYTISIAVADEDGDLLIATQRLLRHELDDLSLARVFLTYPLLTLKVIAGIHYEALLIWLKGIGLHARPAPPDRTVTVVADDHRKKERIQCHI